MQKLSVKIREVRCSMEINSNIKILNPKQYPNPKYECSKLYSLYFEFVIWVIRICLGFRASNLGFKTMCCFTYPIDIQIFTYE